MRIICLGDSIMQFNDWTSFPQSGWVQFLDRFFVPGTQILNFARNGRSSKSFIQEGRLKLALSKTVPEDFVLIQFAHNDEKIQDESRFSSPEKGGEFRKNLAFFIDSFKEKNALPLLLTPVTRRKFSSPYKIENSHGIYPDAIKDVALEKNIPCLDLTAATTDFFEKKGDEGSKRYFMNFGPGIFENFPEGKNDNSHLRPEGAFAVCSLFVQLLKKLDFEHFSAYKPLNDALALNGIYSDKEIDDEKIMWH